MDCSSCVLMLERFAFNLSAPLPQKKHDTNDDVDLDNCVVHTVR